MLFLTFGHRFHQKPKKKLNGGKEASATPKYRKGKHWAKINKMHAKPLHHMQCAFREKETREDILLWVFCTSAILFGPLFQCVAFICFYFTQTTYYGYINIMNILIMQNEWLFSFGVCMLKHWMRRIERKSVLASLSDKQRAKCINQTLHSPNMNYICTDTEERERKLQNRMH